MAWSVIPSLEDLHLSHCCICVAFVMYRRMWQSYPNLMSAPLLPPSSWHNKHLLAMRCPLPLHIRATKNYFIPSWTNYFGYIGDEINFAILSVKMWRAITNFQNSMSSFVFFMLVSFFSLNTPPPPTQFATNLDVEDIISDAWIHIKKAKHVWALAGLNFHQSF